MLNNLSKDLLYLLELIYEEIPNEVPIKGLKNLMPFIINRKRKFQKILDFAEEKKYIVIKKDKVHLTNTGKTHLLELKNYFHGIKKNYTVWLVVFSLIISFLALSLNAIPSAPKVYYSIKDKCPLDISRGSFFSLHLNNYGTIPSSIIITGNGEGMAIKKTNSLPQYQDPKKYLEEGFNESYYVRFQLPPTQYGSSYLGTFGVVISNKSLERPNFSISYTSTGYLWGIIPIQIKKEGHKFDCCYNKITNSGSNYELLECSN